VYPYRHLALNLKLFRVARGFTQTRLGQRAELGQRYISDLERGLRPVAHEHVERLAAALGTTADTLLRSASIRFTAGTTRIEAHAR
jgi:transcriptional regulator with XRE-family HTH domain